jgi:hypothetical protein
MMGLTRARARCDQQRLRVQQARSRVHWWQAQTRAAAVRTATSAPVLLAAAFAGWWVGRRGATGEARVAAKAWITWQAARQLFLQALRVWTFWRGVQVSLGIDPSRRRVVGARQGRAPSATPHSGPPGGP